MGNTVVWKPASSSIPSAWYILKLLEAAGLPPGVINFVPGNASAISEVVAQPPRPGRRPLHRLDGRLQLMWRDDRGADGPLPVVPAHRGRDRRQGLHRGPRLGRPGGARAWRSCAAASSTRARSARPRAASTCRARSGTTCATASSAMIAEIKVGDVARLPQLHGRGHRPQGLREHLGLPGRGEADARRSWPAASATARQGYFIQPTLVETADPGYKLMCEEIFGPVVTRLRLRRREVGGDAAARGRDLARTRSPAPSSRTTARAVRAGDRRPARRGRQLLRERQADRAPSSASSPSAARAPRARTTRPARSSTSCAG